MFGDLYTQIWKALPGETSLLKHSAVKIIFLFLQTFVDWLPRVKLFTQLKLITLKF